jgi:Zn-dependent protease
MIPTILAASVVILLFSVIIHEVSHGVAALYYGDRTAKLAGRLTLNPIPHIDPIGTILLPVFLVFTGSPIIFGWAKPVPVNPFNFRNIRRGELATSAAGIAANLFLAVSAAIFFHLTATSDLVSRSILGFAVDINLLLGVFNLLPIPPLDGSKIVMSFLPPRLAAQYQSISPYGILILFLLYFIPVGGTSLLWVILGTALGFFHAILGV